MTGSPRERASSYPSATSRVTLNSASSRRSAATYRSAAAGKTSPSRLVMRASARPRFTLATETVAGPEPLGATVTRSLVIRVTVRGTEPRKPRSGTTAPPGGEMTLSLAAAGGKQPSATPLSPQGRAGTAGQVYEVSHASLVR